MKADLELVKLVLQRNEIDPRKTAQILEDVQIELNAQVDEDKPPPIKKQFVLLVSDPKGVLQNITLAGWVVQIPEEDYPMVTTDRIIKAAYAYNMTKKGQRMPVKSIGETIEFAPARTFKECSVWPKHKEPVLVVTTDNKIPEEL